MGIYVVASGRQPPVGYYPKRAHAHTLRGKWPPKAFSWGGVVTATNWSPGTYVKMRGGWTYMYVSPTGRRPSQAAAADALSQI